MCHVCDHDIVMARITRWRPFAVCATVGMQVVDTRCLCQKQYSVAPAVIVCVWEDNRRSDVLAMQHTRLSGSVADERDELTLTSYLNMTRALVDRCTLIGAFVVYVPSRLTLYSIA